ncbi:MAG: hypothetical protein PWK00_05440, partial [Coxiella burnetii]|nr:hypothetical protein [Coxiella burnetii]
MIRLPDFENLSCTQLIFLLVKLSLVDTRQGKRLALSKSQCWSAGQPITTVHCAENVFQAPHQSSVLPKQTGRT